MGGAPKKYIIFFFGTIPYKYLCAFNFKAKTLNALFTHHSGPIINCFLNY